MRSRSKVAVARSDIDALGRELTGADVAAASELADGMFNVVYALDLSDGRRAVLKIAPPDSVAVLRYEHDLMAAEIEYYRRARGVAPVPEVLGATADGPDGRAAFAMTRLRGPSLRSRSKRLSTERRAEVQRELGCVVGRLAAVPADRFGYARPDGALEADTWPEAFDLMVEAILADAADYRIAFPARPDEIRALLAKATGALSAVDTPSMVHFDIWDGNVFLRPEEDSAPGARIEGVIDPERWFGGDPLAEMVSTALFKDPAAQTDFLAGYAEATGHVLEFTDAVRLRLAAYRIYLWLIMLTEGAPRGYSGAQTLATRAFVTRLMKRDLAVLASA